MYGPEARFLRRCTATRKDGQPCQAYALWNSQAQHCAAHTYRKRARMALPQWYSSPTRYVPCRCEAYQWPHRPGGGLCRWPDPPWFRSLTPAGTHEQPRFRGELAPVMRLLERRWR